MNRITLKHRSIKDMLSINSDEIFHAFFIEHAIRQYQTICKKKGKGLGTVLAVGASHIEAITFKKFPFKKILLTGFYPPTKKILGVIKKDSRISYQRQNMEKLSFKSKSYDLVFCKEALHHLPRPVLGLYEMLRVCKQAVIIIEPYETFLGKILEFFNLSSTYETNQKGNIKSRDNFVYRWSKNQLKNILNSYYLKSSYRLDLILCWLSNRYRIHNAFLRYLFGFCSWFLGFTPHNQGNYMTALITPGSDIPLDPVEIS